MFFKLYRDIILCIKYFKQKSILGLIITDILLFEFDYMFVQQVLSMVP